jgi:hypothetical protein
MKLLYVFKERAPIWRFALKDAADSHRALEARAISGSTILTI